MSSFVSSSIFFFVLAASISSCLSLSVSFQTQASHNSYAIKLNWQAKHRHKYEAFLRPGNLYQRSSLPRRGQTCQLDPFHTRSSALFVRQSIESNRDNNIENKTSTVHDNSVTNLTEDITNNMDEDTNRNPAGDDSVRNENGWVSNFGRFLLPPSWSKSSSTTTPTAASSEVRNDNVDVSTFDPNSREKAVDTIFLEGSTIPPEGGDYVDECYVIDVDACVDEDEYISLDVNETNITSIGGQVTDADFNSPRHRSGIRSFLWKILRRRFAKTEEEHKLSASEVSSIDGGTQVESTSSEVAQSDQEHTGVFSQQQTSSFDDSNSATYSIIDRSNDAPKQSLRGKSANPTTLSKRRNKWHRRRKRAMVLLSTMKNAFFLFVVTFLAGNLMNQFVDLDENGSYEVHFGKVLSSSPHHSSDVTSGVEQSKGGKLHTVSASNRYFHVEDSARAQELGLVARAVQRIGPAVVRIETETDVNSIIDSNDVSTDGEERGDIFDGISEAPLQPEDDMNKAIDFGQGSGIIINNEGYILTNAHVVNGANRMYVRLTDGRRFRAELRGCDDIVDVAVLKIIPDDAGDEDRDNLTLELPVAQLGDSDHLEVGKFVTAIGSPGGLDNTCTIGIVSGLKRCPKAVGIPDKAGVLEYIQTDAAINQGNSGGPLVDVDSGDVIGINTCIRANMEGTSFAIPINRVMGIVDDLSEGKHITHGFLGVHISTMNPTLARYYNKMQEQSGTKIPEKDGVVIEKVFKNSPAQSGGLKKYDFVCKINGQQVLNADDAHLIIDRAPIGEDLSLVILRGDDERTVQVKPEDLSLHLKKLRENRLKRKKPK